MYRMVNQLIEDCDFNNVSHLVIGWTRSDGSQPHYAHILSQLLSEIRQRAHQNNITTTVIEEAYTSQTSCLDLDEVRLFGYSYTDIESIPFSGSRLSRDIYITSQQQHINADVNSSYNIMIRSQQSKNIITMLSQYQQTPRILKPYIKYI